MEEGVKGSERKELEGGTMRGRVREMRSNPYEKCTKTIPKEHQVSF